VCPVASSAAWRWPGCCCAIPRCGCWMSRWPIWTAIPPEASVSCWSGSAGVVPCCWSAMRTSGWSGWRDAFGWRWHMTEGQLRRRLSRLLHSRAAGRLLALLLAALALWSAIALLALSGWFITAAALAGMATGYMLDVFRPAAVIRPLALTRTLGRYGERLASHQA